MSQTVDAMGKQCPIPVVMARQALQGMQTPDTLVVLVDICRSGRKSWGTSGLRSLWTLPRR